MKKALITAAAIALQACAITIYTTPKPATEAPNAAQAVAPLSCTPESLQALPTDLKDCTCAGNNTWECTRAKKPRKEGIES